MITYCTISIGIFTPLLNICHNLISLVCLIGLCFHMLHSSLFGSIIRCLGGRDWIWFKHQPSEEGLGRVTSTCENDMKLNGRNTPDDVDKLEKDPNSASSALLALPLSLSLSILAVPVALGYTRTLGLLSFSLPPSHWYQSHTLSSTLLRLHSAVGSSCGFHFHALD